MDNKFQLELQQEMNRNLTLTNLDKKTLFICQQLGYRTVSDLYKNFFVFLKTRGATQKRISAVLRYFKAIGITSIPMPAEEYANLKQTINRKYGIFHE